MLCSSILWQFTQGTQFDLRQATLYLTLYMQKSSIYSRPPTRLYAPNEVLERELCSFEVSDYHTVVSETIDQFDPPLLFLDAKGV